ncbi:hypothetical protein SAMN05877838_3285 [Hoeflea halophila]|uniref:PAS domain-containing protein n=1 Tax=Hoeflea halophila TaxID=714899 RepID=A0A286IDZ5_9HYPH|nr:hypothetical protein SAMN05877838_3285 [Hoeflea halophila]
MFKIARADSISGIGAQVQGLEVPDLDVISHYCRIEAFEANLATGVFQLGPAARYHHQLPDQGEFGLYNLVKCYDDEYRNHVLELYELAAMRPSSFCFSTTIMHTDGSQIPIMCIGESSNFTEDGNGAINGVFVFPKFKLLDKAPPITQ